MFKSWKFNPYYELKNTIVTKFYKSENNIKL